MTWITRCKHCGKTGAEPHKETCPEHPEYRPLDVSGVGGEPRSQGGEEWVSEEHTKDIGTNESGAATAGATPPRTGPSGTSGLVPDRFGRTILCDDECHTYDRERYPDAATMDRHSALCRRRWWLVGHPGPAHVKHLIDKLLRQYGDSDFQVARSMVEHWASLLTGSISPVGGDPPQLVLSGGDLDLPGMDAALAADQQKLEAMGAFGTPPVPQQGGPQDRCVECGHDREVHGSDKGDACCVVNPPCGCEQFQELSGDAQFLMQEVERRNAMDKRRDALVRHCAVAAK